MGRAPCCDKANVKKGPWSPEEDAKLKEFIEKHGTGGNWIALPQKAGLKRCGKSCRLRWLNYLRPNIKHGEFSDDEDRIICSLFASIGSRWSIIAAQLPGRTDNDIKNYWNTKLKKKLLGLPPSQRKPHSQDQQQQQQQRTFQSSSLHATDAPTQLSKVSSYTTSSKPPLSALEGFPISHEVLNSLTTPGALLNGSMHNQYQMKDGCSTLLMFGGEPSCSSSDGSCNQISYGKEIDYDLIGGVNGVGGQHLNLESLFSSNGLGENQRLLLDAGFGGGDGGSVLTEKGNNVGQLGEASLDFGAYEDIKQLITSSSNGVCNNLFLEDPANAIRSSSYKSQGRAMYYY